MKRSHLPPSFGYGLSATSSPNTEITCLDCSPRGCHCPLGGPSFPRVIITPRRGETTQPPQTGCSWQPPRPPTPQPARGHRQVMGALSLPLGPLTLHLDPLSSLWGIWGSWRGEIGTGGGPGRTWGQQRGPGDIWGAGSTQWEWHKGSLSGAMGTEGMLWGPREETWEEPGDIQEGHKGTLRTHGDTMGRGCGNTGGVMGTLRGLGDTGGSVRTLRRS